jgi:hypothetical protein
MYITYKFVADWYGDKQCTSHFMSSGTCRFCDVSSDDHLPVANQFLSDGEIVYCFNSDPHDMFAIERSVSISKGAWGKPKADFSLRRASPCADLDIRDGHRHRVQHTEPHRMGF